MPVGRSLFKFKKLDGSCPVTLVPTGYCFLHRESKPEGTVRAADVRAFAELSLEGLSPFPPEQLAWGWLDAPKQSSLWIVAACKDRLAREAVALENRAYYVLPALIGACALQTGKARRIFLWEENTLTCLGFSENTLWPSQIVVEPLPAPTLQAAFAKRAQLLEDKRLNSMGEALEGLYAEPSAHATPSGGLAFELKHFKDEQADPCATRIRWPRAHEKLLWQADLRDRAFLDAEGKKRARALLIWHGCVAALAAAVLLLLWQSSLQIADKRLDASFAKIETQKPLVEAVRQNQDLLMKIEQASSSELQPFLMLGKLNQIRLADESTKALYLLNAQTEGLMGLTVQGKGPSIPAVNTFVEALKKSGLFTAVDLTNVQGRASGADFTLKLTFKPLPPPKAGESQLPQAATAVQNAQPAATPPRA